jgi:hypothetical protein
MVRIIIMFAAGILFLGLGVRNLTLPVQNYLLIAGNFLAGLGLLLYAWTLRTTGKGNIVAAIIFIAGFILTIAANYF